MLIKRVLITQKAQEVVKTLIKKYGDMLFYQSGGCCDGSTPMIYPVNEFRIGDNDVMVGKISNCNFYMAKDQFNYWKHTHLTVDVLKTDSGGFSYEVPLGFKFVIKSRLFDKEELNNLEDVFIGDKIYKI